MTKLTLYRIEVRYYRNRKDMESGIIDSSCDSGFLPMILREAQTCLSKMSDENVGGRIRQNIIVLA